MSTIALPIALGGFGWWDAAVALLALPLIAALAATLITAALRRLAPGSLAARHAVCSPQGETHPSLDLPLKLGVILKP